MKHVELVVEHAIKRSEETGEIEKVKLLPFLLLAWTYRLQFPILSQNNKPPPAFQKSKSLTAAELCMEIMSDDEVSAVGDRLKLEEPPMSLEQTRECRARITQQRKDTINLIRKRTASRSSTSVRPVLEPISKGDKKA